MKVTLLNANFPKDKEERVYHMGIKKGEIANRILTVGDSLRARKIAQCLDVILFEKQSQRGFLTITGKYKDVLVSIVSIGMGHAMMDFFVREARACIEGTMAIIRFGSCGSLSSQGPPGTVMVPEGGYFIRRNLDYFADQRNYPELKPYLYSGVFYADRSMSRLLVRTLQALMPVMMGGLNAEGCSFYSSQGRHDEQFRDENGSVLKDILKQYPTTHSVEMETSTLFHLAHCAKYPIRTAACMQVFADRVHDRFITPETVSRLEPIVGKACLDTLIQIDIDHTGTKI